MIITVCRLKTKMRSNLQILFILLSVTKFDVISAFFGPSKITPFYMYFSLFSKKKSFNIILLKISQIVFVAIVICEEFQFYGNCIKDKLCLCYRNSWYNTSFGYIKSVSSEINTFSDICDSCSSRKLT